MGKRNFKAIAASFNLDDEKQNEAYEYVKKQSNSSFYLKSLVLLDMAGKFKRADYEAREDKTNLDFDSFS